MEDFEEEGYVIYNIYVQSPFAYLSPSKYGLCMIANIHLGFTVPEADGRSDADGRNVGFGPTEIGRGGAGRVCHL
jgi:hypothetical protein